MNRQAQLSGVVINNFGQMVRSEVKELIAYKAKLIKSILHARYKLGYSFDLKTLDSINDMDIDELELMQMENDERLERRHHD